MALLRSTENEGPLCGHSCQCRGNDVGIKEGRIKSSSASSEIHLFFNTFPVKTQTHKKKIGFGSYGAKATYAFISKERCTDRNLSGSCLAQVCLLPEPLLTTSV